MLNTKISFPILYGENAIANIALKQYRSQDVTAFRLRCLDYLFKVQRAKFVDFFYFRGNFHLPADDSLEILTRLKCRFVFFEK